MPPSAHPKSSKPPAAPAPTVAVSNGAAGETPGPYCPDCGQAETLPSVEEIRATLADPEAQAWHATVKERLQAMSPEQLHRVLAGGLLHEIAERLGVEPVQEEDGSLRFDFPDEDAFEQERERVEQEARSFHTCWQEATGTPARSDEQFKSRESQTQTILESWRISRRERRSRRQSPVRASARRGARPRGRRARSSRVTRAGPSSDDDPSDLDPPLHRRSLDTVELEWLAILRELHPGIVFAYEDEGAA